MTILEARIRRRNAAYKTAHREEILANNAAYRASHKEERAASDAAYRAAHREEIAAYHAAYRADHKEERAANNAAYRADHRDALIEKQRQDRAEFVGWLQISRSVNGCADCGAHEGWLEHHHVDPATKRYDISNMCNRSFDALEDELEKCAVLCNACHRKRHVAMREGAIT